MTWGHVCPLQAPFWRRKGPKYGYFWVKIKGFLHAFYQVGYSIWKVFSAPYYILIHGKTWLTAIYAISRHPYEAGEGPKYGYFWVEIQLLWQACYQVGYSIWKVSIAPYHILIYGQTLLTAIYALSRHPYGAGRVQNMAIFGSKSNYHERLVTGRAIPPGKCFVCHIIF